VSWRCPDCGREFVQRTREHSCDLTSVASHLEKTSPDVRAAFEAVRAALERIGPHEVVPLKTMLTFRRASNFAGVTFTKARMDLGMFLPERVHHPRIGRVEKISPGKLAHHVRLSAASDVDEELVSWLRQAYRIGVGHR
jgi:hypothetical protein